MSNEKLPKWKALAIFSSDALSSIGYGPEQIAIILALPGVLAYGYFGHASLAILLLLALVTFSYVQVARANPGGGGSYSVAMQNIGELPALVAAAALFADYTLTVAVSISSGTDAIVSAFPVLIPYSVAIDMLVLFGLLMIINLRGVRESSNVFVLPTYAFIIGILAMILTGVIQVVTGADPILPAASVERQPLDWPILFLVLRAFASGCSSMTGVEAISNGVPMFKKPEVHNAVATTYWMSGILGGMFAGISFLIMHFHILPEPNVTALSTLTENIFGHSWGYFYVQISTMLVLYLAANTSYNGLPPLLSILARDGYMPRFLGHRGDRLSFSNGIILLSVVAGSLIYIFHGNVEHLLSLYAVGVFLSFTIAQTGLVIHWRRERTRGWRHRALLNGIGATVTGAVVLVIAITKFFYGAWMVLIFIPAMIFIFKAIHRHYLDMSEQLHLTPVCVNPAVENIKIGRNIVILPISSATCLVANALLYARSIADEIIAVNVATDEDAARKVQEIWAAWNPGIELQVVYSPYRMIIHPLLEYIEQQEAIKKPEDYITVLIPEFETRKWWHRLLHNQTGWILQTLLVLRENVIVTVVPFRLKK